MCDARGAQVQGLGGAGWCLFKAGLVLGVTLCTVHAPGKGECELRGGGPLGSGWHTGLVGRGRGRGVAAVPSAVRDQGHAVCPHVHFMSSEILTAMSPLQKGSLPHSCPRWGPGVTCHSVTVHWSRTVRGRGVPCSVLCGLLLVSVLAGPHPLPSLPSRRPRAQLVAGCTLEASLLTAVALGPPSLLLGQWPPPANDKPSSPVEEQSGPGPRCTCGGMSLSVSWVMCREEGPGFQQVCCFLFKMYLWDMVN